MTDLSQSLSSTYGIIYALALLLPSLLLTFAGGFTTLDRTASVKDKNPEPKLSASAAFYPVHEPPKRSFLRLSFQGGLGGLAAGMAFGVHVVAFLTLVITNKTTLRPLTPIEFLIVWLTVSLVLALLGSSFRPIALIFIACLGGSSLTLFIEFIFRPPLIVRFVLLLLLIAVALLGTFLPIHPRFHFQRWTVRASAAWGGSLGLIITAGILSRDVPSWENAWMRFAVKYDPNGQWTGSKVDGLTVGLVGFALLGVGTDWLLERKLGQDPSQRWEDYMSRASSWTGDGLGLFEPDRPLWKRLLLKKRPTRPTPLDSSSLFPKDEETLLGSRSSTSIPSSTHTGTRSTPTPIRPHLSIPPRFDSSTSARSAVPPYAEIDELHNEGDFDLDPPPRFVRSPPPLVRPPLANIPNLSRSSVSLSGATVVDAGLGGAVVEAEKARTGAHDVHVEDISSHSPSSNSNSNVRREFDQDEESPTMFDFNDTRRPLLLPPIPEVSPNPTGTGTSDVGARHDANANPNPNHNTNLNSDSSHEPENDFGYTQTPSLIRAIERIQRARNESYSPQSRAGARSPSPTSPSSPSASSSPTRPRPGRKSSTSASTGANIGSGAQSQSPGRAQGRRTPAPTPNARFPDPEWESFWDDVLAKARTHSRPMVVPSA